MPNERNRWYDAFPELSKSIESLKTLEPSQMNRLMRNVKEIIIESDANLINQTVMEYPLGIERRWYDRDPLSWMTINALRFADENLRKRVLDFLREEMASMNT